MRKTLLTAALAAGLLSAAPAVAKTSVFLPQQAQSGLNLNKFKPVDQRTVAFRPKAIDENGFIVPDVTEEAGYYQSINTVGTLIGPDNTDWFYVLEPETKVLVKNEYYTQYDYIGFTIKVYDDHMNFMGQAKGSIEHPKGAKLCQSITVGPQVTRSFFNTNSTDCELMIIANFNPEKGTGYKQQTYVFSLQKDEASETPCLITIPGSYVVAKNASTNISENYWIAFFEESTWEIDADKEPKFTFYRRAEYGTSAQYVGELPFNELLTASDGVSDGVLPLAVASKGNTIYFASWHFEKPFFEDPDDPNNDNLTPDNNFMIDLYKGSYSGLELVKTTKVPMTLPEGEFNLRSYSMGNFLGAGDLTFDFSTGDFPAYIVSVVDSSIQGDNTNSYYAVYDTDGNVLKTFGNNNSGFGGMSDLPGLPVQYCFDMKSSVTGENGLVLVDYPSMNEVGFLNKLFVYEDDIWQLGGNPDRLMTSNGVLYVAPILPSNGAAAARLQYIGYFKADGTLDHVDRVEIPGSSVAKVLTFIEGPAVNPYLFNTSKTTEYLHWVYRYKGNSDSDTTLEMVVTDDKGNILTSRMMPDNIKLPFCTLCNVEKDPCLAVSYSLSIKGADDISVLDIIKLPLNKFEGEGTVENPYLIKTFGDLDQVRNNLTSHFALANSIDCEGRPFRQIEGRFLGSIDGRGNEISGLVINAGTKGGALFQSVGQNIIVDEDSEAAPETVAATIKNLNLYKPVISVGEATTLREFAFLAGEARNTLIENVHVIEPSFEAYDNLKATVGLLVHSAFESQIIGSSVTGADINFPASIGIGGIAHTVAGGSVKSTSFIGSITAAQAVGGIAVQNRSTSAVIDDCHVKADLAANHTVGGILANSSRSAISRSLVEGTIAVSDPTVEYTEEDVVMTYNVGGIVGKLESATFEDPDPDGFLAIDKCVVALESLTLSDDAQNANAVGAHRIVGWTSIDGGPVIEWVIKDGENAEPVLHPAEPEARLGANYVVSALAEIETADPALATEGTTFAETADQAWFTSLGYAFDGATAAEPWVFEAERPALFHESGVSSALYFTEAEIEGTEGTEINVPLVFRGIDPESIMFSSTDESGAAVSNFVDPGEVVVSLIKPGTYTITATNYFKTATLKVTVKEYVSVDQIGADQASAITFDGSAVKAEGRAITIYNAQGQIVASGNNAVATSTLLPGVYFAKAVAADGSAATLKFAAK